MEEVVSGKERPGVEVSGEKPKGHRGQRVGKKARRQTGASGVECAGYTAERRKIMSLETREEQGEPER